MRDPCEKTPDFPSRGPPDPTFRTPPQLNTPPQKPPGGDLDINNPVADDCEQLSGKAHGRRRMATVCYSVARARRLDGVGELVLLEFTQDGVPTWDVNRRAKAGSSRDDLTGSGTAETFDTAMAAVLFEARVQSSE
jgi:hypothetical protein